MNTNGDCPLAQSCIEICCDGRRGWMDFEGTFLRLDTNTDTTMIVCTPNHLTMFIYTQFPIQITVFHGDATSGTFSTKIQKKFNRYSE